MELPPDEVLALLAMRIRLVLALPEAVPLAALTQIWSRIVGLCQKRGATSMTTWYWFSVL